MNDAAAVNSMVTNLSGLARRFHCAILVIHHPTKAAASLQRVSKPSWDPDSYYGGSGALRNAASITVGMAAPEDHPQHRCITSTPNTAARLRQWFEVCSPERAWTGAIDYWTPCAAPDQELEEEDAEALVKVYASLEASVSPRSIALLLSSKPDKQEPAASDKRKATALIGAAEPRGLITQNPARTLREYILTEGGKALVSSMQSPQKVPNDDTGRWSDDPDPDLFG